MKSKLHQQRLNPVQLSCEIHVAVVLVAGLLAAWFWLPRASSAGAGAATVRELRDC